MNMILKSILVMILIIIMLLAFTGCGTVTNNKKEDNGSKEQTSETTNNNNQERIYTDEMYQEAIYSYYVENRSNEHVAVVNISGRENGFVIAQVYLTIGDNYKDYKKGYEKYKINEKNGKGKSESNLEIDILEYLDYLYNEKYNNSKNTSSSDSQINNK